MLQHGPARMLAASAAIAAVVTLAGDFAGAAAAGGSEAAPFLAACGRSPIPRPGEHLSHPLPARRLGRIAPPRPVAPRPDAAAVAWDQAGAHVGRRITVRGKVVVAHDIGPVCFLNFAADWHGKFYVVIYKSVYDDLPAPPEDYFRGKTIRVTGKVVRYHHDPDRPQIQVHHARDIQVVRPPPR